MLTVRCFLLCVCVCGGVVHHEFSTHGHNVKKQYYPEVIKCLQEAVKGKNDQFKKGEKMDASNITMHLHIQSPLINHDFLAKPTNSSHNPPCSPHLTPEDFF